MAAQFAHMSVHKLNVWYGSEHALQNVSIEIPRHRITAIVGPSGCGKTTLLKSLNRLIELAPGARIDGRIFLDGQDIYEPGVDATEVRTRIGLLAQKPFPLPMSIYDNVAYGPRIHGLARGNLAQIVQAQLEATGLWDEVKDRLKTPATALSVGQQQRLCLARALAVEPEVLLCDESTSALDPISARAIEDLLRRLKHDYTIVMVTHDLDQARRVADHLVVLWMGEVIEQGPAARLFETAAQPLAQAYLRREVG